MSLQDPESLSQLAMAVTVAFVLAGAVLTGPLFGIFGTDSGSDGLGDGTASIESVSVSTDDIVVTHGRYGTDTWYLRVPDSAVAVRNVEKRPRLIAQVIVPELNVEETETKQLSPGSVGTHRLTLGSIAIGPNRPTNDTYRGHLTVRVQSFTVDETVYNETVAVEVRG